MMRKFYLLSKSNLAGCVPAVEDASMVDASVIRLPQAVSSFLPPAAIGICYQGKRALTTCL